MKKFLCAALVFFGAVALCAAAGISEEARRGNEKAEMSYAFGMVTAAEFFLGMGIELNYDAFLRGFRGVMENQETRYSMDEALDIIQAAFAEMEAAHAAAQAVMWEQNLLDGAAFLAENALRPGVITTASGLQIEMLVEGSGEKPDISDVVLVHYHGTTIDGTVFDSTLERGVPIEIPLDRVIPGWAEGLRMIREGGKAALFIPPDLAYGSQGAGGVIEPNSTIIFTVELISIVRSDNE